MLNNMYYNITNLLNHYGEFCMFHYIHDTSFKWFYLYSKYRNCAQMKDKYSSQWEIKTENNLNNTYMFY